MGKFLTLFFGLFVSTFMSLPAKAMDYGTVFQEAEILEAIMSPANKDGISTLKLRFTNLALNNLTIVGVKSAHHSGSEIVAELDTEKFVTLDSLSVPAEETLDMEEAGISVHLLNMKTPYTHDGMIKLKLILTQGELPFKAHIRPAPAF